MSQVNGQHVPRHVPWHQSLGKKRCGSVFATSIEGVGRSSAIIESAAGLGEARAVLKPRGPSTCRGTCCPFTWFIVRLQ